MRGWILAGGRSSRFGSDKALYEVEGVPMIVRLARILREAGLEPGVVAKRPYAALATRIESDGQHPLYGVAAALDEPAFVTPCDLVDLTSAHVVALLTRAPAYARGHPLLGAFPADAARARAIAVAGGSVREFVAPYTEVDVGPLTNLNHPRPGE